MKQPITFGRRLIILGLGWLLLSACSLPGQEAAPPPPAEAPPAEIVPPEAGPAPTETAPDETQASPTEALVAPEPTSEAPAADFVYQAGEQVVTALRPSNVWSGPISGSLAPTDRLIVFVASDLRDAGVRGVSEGVLEASQALGWQVQVLDGQGNEAGQTGAFNQAVSLQPAGIILAGVEAQEQPAGIEAAAAAGIPIVGWHVAPIPGPVAGWPVFANVMTEAGAMAEMTALYAVAQSEGTAGVVILTDSTLSGAKAQVEAMQAVIEQCPGCTLLAVPDIPLAEVSNQLPQQTRALLDEHGEAWTYTLTTHEAFVDILGPALEAAGKGAAGPPFNLSIGNGGEAAYQRVRDHRFQVGFVPEPLLLHGWQLVDELNRAWAGQAWSGYVTPVHLVTAENIEFDEGPTNRYEPDNGYREVYLDIWQGVEPTTGEADGEPRQ